MNAGLLVHQWKKELRGLRPVLWIWSPLLVLHVLCVLHGWDWYEAMDRHSPLRYVVLATSGWFVLLPAMVFSMWPTRGDLPLDCDAFWRTKPVPGWAVAAAKVLALATVFLLPAFAVDAGLVLRVGGVSALDGLLLEMWLVRMGAILAVLALTALAGGGFRMVFLVAVAGIILGFCISGVLSLVSPDRVLYTPTVIASRFLVAGGCTVVGSVAILYTLYQLGRSRAAWTCGIATALVTVLVFLFWRVDLYHQPVAQVGEEPQLSIAPSGVETSPYDPTHVYTIALDVQLAPPPLLASAYLDKAWVSIRGQAGQPTAAGWAHVSVKHPDAGRSLVTADQTDFLNRLGAHDLGGATPKALLFSACLRVPFHHLIPGACTVEAEWLLYDFRKVGTVPLEVGSRLRFGGNTIEITGLGWNPGNGGHVLVDVREDVLQPPFDLNGPTAALPHVTPTGLFGYAILDDAGDVMLAIPNPPGSYFLPPGRNENSLLLIFHRNRCQLKLPPRQGDAHGMELIETYRGRTLVVLQRVYVSSMASRAEAVWEGE